MDHLQRDDVLLPKGFMLVYRVGTNRLTCTQRWAVNDQEAPEWMEGFLVEPTLSRGFFSSRSVISERKVIDNDPLP